MRKRIVSVLLTALMCLAMLPDTAVFAIGSFEDGTATVNDGAGDYSNENDESTEANSEKSLIVDEDATVVTGSTYTIIQDALDYINTQDDKDGWTINIKSGNYTYFTVKENISNLTITGETGAIVNCSDGSIQLMGDTITLEGITFTAEDTAWSVPVIKDASSNAGLYYDSMVTIKNCDFKGTNAGCALWICRLNATIQNCTFDGFSYAIEIINETSTAAKNDKDTTTGTITIDGNTVTNCDFFIHYGVRSGITFVVTDNIVTGSADKFCVSLFAWAGESINVTGNYFKYAAFGLQNATDGTSAESFLETNTFDYSYAADDYYNYSTGKDYSVTYYAPDQLGSELAWSISTTGVTGDMKAKFAAALEGHEKDNPLTFSTTDGEGDMVCMGLAYHALILVKIKSSDPSLTKVIVEKTTDENGDTVSTEVTNDTVSAGDIVEFQLTSIIPTKLQNYINYKYDDATGKVVGTVKTAEEVEAEKASTTENGSMSDDTDETSGDLADISEASDEVIEVLLAEAISDDDADTNDTGESAKPAEYWLVFHDVMDNGLTLDEDNVQVTLVIDGNDVDTTLTAEYYKTNFSADDCTFEISVDLLKLYTKGYIAEKNFGYASIVVTYSATLKSDIEPGAYENIAWVSFPEGKSKEDKVTVINYGISIFKYDQSTYTADDDTSSEEVGTENDVRTSKGVRGLGGAEFTLYSDEDCTDVVKTLTSGSDGYATLNSVSEGTYYLKETKAPDNYVSSSKIITITIPDDVNDTYYVCVDMANAAIPDTGGMGTTIFRIVGGCLLLAAVIVFIVSRRRRDDDEE